MALPTLSKTWQLDINNTIVSAAELPWYQQLAFELKEALTGFASNPWTVVASCDSVSVDNAGGDLWVDSGDIIWGTGNHSWIVLQNASGSQICLAFDYGSTSNQDGFVIFSPGGEFLSANGGTDGLLNARPTAPDEYDARTGLDALAWWHNGVTTIPNGVYHIWHSTDGTVTYIVGLTANIPHTFIALGSIKDPIIGHTEPFIGSWVASSSTATWVPVFAVMNDAARIRTAHNGVAGNCYITCPGFATAMNPEHAGSAVAEEISGELMLYEAGLFANDTVGLRGHKGKLHDVYWTTHQVSDSGDTYPNNASARQWVQFGHLVFPWTGDATVPLTA